MSDDPNDDGLRTMWEPLNPDAQQIILVYINLRVGIKRGWIAEKDFNLLFRACVVAATGNSISEGE
mgnify:CR=1 FL=1